MSRKSLTCGALGTIVLATACSGQPQVPTAPSPTPAIQPTPAPSPQAPMRQILGLVLDEGGAPVRAATVSTSDGPGGTTTSDDNGFYQVTARVNGDGNGLTITKTGYDKTYGWAEGTSDVRQNFYLYTPIPLTAGQEVHLTLTSDNSMCGLEDEFRCRAISILMQTDGKLAVDAVPDDPRETFSLSLGGPGDVNYPVGGNTTGAVGTAGQTIAVEVLHGWNRSPAGVTIRTSLVP